MQFVVILYLKSWNRITTRAKKIAEDRAWREPEALNIKHIQNLFNLLEIPKFLNDTIGSLSAIPESTTAELTTVKIEFF